MDLFCVGISHHTADVQIRERFAGHAAIHRVLREEAGCAEALLLTTCNRVEVYAAGEPAISTERIAHCLLANGMQPLEEEVGVFYRYEALRCVQHLFRVASGLDSMVIGETEILGQAKKAYAAARESGSAGPYLHRLFQRAFRVAKQVRTHTGITRGAVSVGSVAVDLAEQIFGHFETRKVLLLGAGEASERTARALLKRGVSDIRVTNRSPEHAEALAAVICGCALPRSPDHFDLAEMSHLIDEAVASKPDGLIVSIPDVAILRPSIRAAVAAGIPVISINSGLEVSKQLGCLMHIGQEDESAGKKAGERMKATGVKNALILNQEVGNSGLDQRIRGFKDGFEGPFHHTQVLPVTIDFEQCQRAVNDYLSENSTVDGIVALGPVAAEPSLQAIKELNKVRDVKVCTFDTSPEILNALVNNQLEFAVDQQQWLQGYLPVIFLRKLRKIRLHGPKRSDPDGSKFRHTRERQESAEYPQQRIRLKSLKHQVFEFRRDDVTCSLNVKS